jgi:sugar lactone lactonase YvrE
MADARIEVVPVAKLGWGESASWDPETRRLVFVDCIAREVGGFDESGGRELPRTSVASLPTALYLTAGETVVVQLDDGLHAVRPGEAGSELLVAAPPGELRFNDGVVDPHGAVVTGSLIFGPDARADAGSYWRYAAGSGWRKLHAGKGNTNGPRFSPDGAVFYVADSGAGLIHRFDYGAEGELNGERVFADLRDLGGAPDGAAIDADGCYWTSLYAGSSLVQLTPEGKVERVVPLPASHPTSLAFGGDDLDVVYVTTIGATDVGLELSGPHSGALLRIEGLGTRGLPPSRMAGPPSRSARVGA